LGAISFVEGMDSGLIFLFLGKIFPFNKTRPIPTAAPAKSFLRKTSPLGKKIQIHLVFAQSLFCFFGFLYCFGVEVKTLLDKQIESLPKTLT